MMIIANEEKQLLIDEICLLTKRTYYDTEYKHLPLSMIPVYVLKLFIRYLREFRDCEEIPEDFKKQRTVLVYYGFLPRLRQSWAEFSIEQRVKRQREIWKKAQRKWRVEGKKQKQCVETN